MASVARWYYQTIWETNSTIVPRNSSVASSMWLFSIPTEKYIEQSFLVILNGGDSIYLMLINGPIVQSDVEGIISWIVHLVAISLDWLEKQNHSNSPSSLIFFSDALN